MHFMLCVILKLSVVTVVRIKAYDKGKLLDYDHTNVWWKGWKATTTTSRTTMDDGGTNEENNKLRSQLLAWNAKLALVNDLGMFNDDQGENKRRQHGGMPSNGQMLSGILDEDDMYKDAARGSKDIFYGGHGGPPPPGMTLDGGMPGGMPGMPPRGRIPQGIPPGMPSGGMESGMPSRGMQPRMTYGGMQPGMPNGGLQLGMPSGSMQPSMAPGGRPPVIPPRGRMPGSIASGGRLPRGMQPGIPPEGWSPGGPPGMPPGGMQPGMPPGGMQPGFAPGGQMPFGAQPGMPPGNSMPEGMQSVKFPRGRLPGGMPPGDPPGGWRPGGIQTGTPPRGLTPGGALHEMPQRGRIPRGMQPGMPPRGRTPRGIPHGGQSPAGLQTISDRHTGYGEEHDSNEYEYDGRDNYANNKAWPAQPVKTGRYQGTIKPLDIANQLQLASRKISNTTLMSLSPLQMERIRQLYNYNAYMYSRKGSAKYSTIVKSPFLRSMNQTTATENVSLTNTSPTSTSQTSEATSTLEVTKIIQVKATNTLPVVDINDFPGYPDIDHWPINETDIVTEPHYTPIIEGVGDESINDNTTLSFPPGPSSWFFGFPDGGYSKVLNINTVNTSGRPLPTKLNEEIKATGVGMFSVFLRYCFEIVSKKDEEIRPVMVGLQENFERLQLEGRMMSLDNEMLSIIYAGFKMMTSGPIETLKQKATLAHHLMSNRKTLLSKELNHLIDVVDLKFTAEDGTNMLRILGDLESFSKLAGNGYNIAADFTENIAIKITERFNDNDRKVWTDAVNALRKQPSSLKTSNNFGTNASEAQSKVPEKGMKDHIAARRFNLIKENTIQVVKRYSKVTQSTSRKHSRSFRKIGITPHYKVKSKTVSKQRTQSGFTAKTEIRRDTTNTPQSKDRNSEKGTYVSICETKAKNKKHNRNHYTSVANRRNQFHGKKKTKSEDKLLGRLFEKLHDRSSSSDRKLKRKLFQHLKKRHRKTYRLLKRRLKHRIKKLWEVTRHNKYSSSVTTLRSKVTKSTGSSLSGVPKNETRSTESVFEGTESPNSKLVARALATDNEQIPIFNSPEESFEEFSASCSMAKKATLKSGRNDRFAQVTSSESDEEMLLRSKLREALAAGYPRRDDGGSLSEVSISTDDEPLLKMNIYRALGFH